MEPEGLLPCSLKPCAEPSATPRRRIRSGGAVPRVLNLGARWRWVVSFTPRPL